jgi:hypothetical protein
MQIVLHKMNDMTKQCRCSGWKGDDIVPMVDDDFPDAVFAEFDVLKKRTPWLELARCKTCGNHWYIGTDTVDDAFYVIRLTEEQVRSILDRDQWPVKFDGMHALWPDDEWLKLFKFSSLEDWQEKNKV